MEQLWSEAAPSTVRQVHQALASQRTLSYSTVTTVLQRLVKKHFVVQSRDHRAHRYVPTRGRSELVAELMAVVLEQVSDAGVRQATLVRFVERLGPDEAAALRGAFVAMNSHGTVRDDSPLHVPGSAMMSQVDPNAVAGSAC